MNLSCLKCNYSTDIKSNWTRHQKSKKHLEKTNMTATNPHKPIEMVKKVVENEISCEFCKSKFSRKSHLARHFKSCHIANKPNNNEKLLFEVINELREDKKRLEQDKKQLIGIVNNSGAIIHKSMNIAQTSLNALTYANKYFIDTPALELIDDMELVVPTNRTGNYNIIDIALTCDKSEKLAKYIGDKLVEYYKKDNPKRQTLWTGDTARLNYIVRKVIDIDSDKLCWSKDKNGEHIRKTIVEPILSSIDELLDGFIKGKTKQMTDNIDDIDYVRHSIRELGIVGNLSRDIGNKSIENEIIRMIAPPLFLDTSNKSKPNNA